ncbi:reverse transcriptase domain-containing protein [Tanacetum coccineum]
MARMDAMAIKMDALYKELQSRAKQPTPDLDDDDILMSREEEDKIMQTFSRMPNYGKFLKELISNKNKIEQIFAAFLSDESFAILQSRVPPKLGDPESFLIPCNFNKTFSCNALADLGASINLMPYSLYAKLSLETLKPTKMSVRLADRSLYYPVGIAKNILVEVDEGSKILYSIEGIVLEEEIFSEFDKFIAMASDENYDSESDEEEPKFEKITINKDYKIKTSLEEPPTDLERKPLPDNLEYVFLEEPSFLPVIISSQLSAQNKIKLIQLLDDKKPVVQKQRRLNPNMQEVVKKEIVKLLDTVIIYPILDSPWVSPIHYVPKKGGIIVVTNENDELVPTRTLRVRREVSGAGLEVDNAKINLISKLPPPANIKGVRSFLGTENVVADHLSRIDNNMTSDDSEVNDNFPEETLMEINTRDEPWFADFANYLVGDIIPKGTTYQQKNKFFSDLKHYFWEKPYLFKKLFRRFGMPKALISDRGTQFCNKIMEKTMKRYGVSHRFSTSYHPQTSGQVENTNRALKRILEKTVKDNSAIWSRKLDDALWVFRAAYKTPTRTTPYKLIYGKNRHMPFEIEHRAYWALKNCNPDLIAAEEK